MKKIFVFACVFALSLLGVTVVNGQEMQEKTAPIIKIKYDLAYPGILPDNPLYKLKLIRDKISIMLISDPKRKIEFYLLQADKGILATAMLVDKNKIQLAKETLLKAENNFTILSSTLGTLREAPEEGFFKKLETASLKHQEVILSLANRIPKGDRKTFDQALEFSKRNLNTVKKFKNRRFFEIQ